jgi:2-methylisocitrate lyase-like PEP mutase family enzyme
MMDVRRRIAEGPALLLPGVGSPFEALLVEQAGFEAVYVSGYASAANIRGVPDIGIIGLETMAHNVAAIAARVSIPLIVDADTGYGDVANVRFTVERLEDCGASGIQIEDQVWPKRCGHMVGKRVIDAAQACRKIEAAVASRRSSGTAIIARTDAVGPNGFEDATRRAMLFREAGADATFIDAPEDLEQLRRIPELVPGPTVANMSESGRTPIRPFDELVGMGFRIVLFPTMALRIAGHALQEALLSLRESGTSDAHADRMLSLDSCNRILGLDDFQAFESSIIER